MLYQNNCSSVVNNPPEFTGARPSPSSTKRQHGKAKSGAPTTQTKLLWFIGLKQGRATIRSIHEWTCGLCPKKNEKRTDYTYRGLDGWSERVTPSLWWLPSKLASGVVMAWLIGSRTTDGTIWWVIGIGGMGQLCDMKDLLVQTAIRLKRWESGTNEY